MSEKPACARCVFFNHTEENGGECRRREPRLVDRLYVVSRWPYVALDKWCGEFATEWPNRKNPPTDAIEG